jgi:ribokinase
MKKSIVVVGSSNTDMIIKLPHIPRPGETVIGGKFSTAPGGKGANQAVAAARAGGDVSFIARVGDDIFGRQALENFAMDGLNIRHIINDTEHPSGVALIFVDEKGENSIAVASGANAALTPADIVKANSTISSAKVLLMQLETPLETVTTAAEIAFEHHVQVILNPAPSCPLDDSLLKLISIITPNEHEAEFLTGVKVDDEASAEKASDALLTKGVHTVIITLGAKGVYVKSHEFKGIISGFSVKAEDTTAAGDVFNGVFAVSLAEGKCLFDAVRFACAAAAISVTKLGAQTSAPTRDEIEDFLKKNE